MSTLKKIPSSRSLFCITIFFAILAQVSCSLEKPESCSEISGWNSANSSCQLSNCLIYPDGPTGKALKVLCDFKTEADGGGWTVIHKRSSGPRDEFNRSWSEYVEGFGSLEGNFWLGLDNIRSLTKDGNQEMRIDLGDFLGNTRYAKYARFSISDASDFYRLSLGTYYGNGGDSLNSPNLHHIYRLNGMRFSTRDMDNDQDSGNCADDHSSGWWFNACFLGNLNGLYHEKGEMVEYWRGMIWQTWLTTQYTVATAQMKVRTRK